MQDLQGFTVFPICRRTPAAVLKPSRNFFLRSHDDSDTTRLCPSSAPENDAMNPTRVSKILLAAVVLLGSVLTCPAYEIITVRLKDKSTGASIPDATVNLEFTSPVEIVHLTYDHGTSVYTAPKERHYVGREAKVAVSFPTVVFQGQDRPKYKFQFSDEPKSVSISSEGSNTEYVAVALPYPEFYSELKLYEADRFLAQGKVEQALDCLDAAIEALPRASTYQRKRAALERLLPNPSESAVHRMQEFVGQVKSAEWIGADRFNILLDFSSTIAVRKVTSKDVKMAALEAAENAISLQLNDPRSYSTKYQLLAQSADYEGAAQVIKTFFDNNPNPPEKTIITFVNDWLAYVEAAGAGRSFSDVPTFDELTEVFKQYQVILQRAWKRRRYDFAVNTLDPKTNTP
jgi:hypothetical protein